MTKKNLLFLALLAMAAMVFSGCSSDDDDRFTVCPTGDGWGGKWQFVEMLDGPRGAKQPAAHTMEFKADGKVLFNCEGAFPFDEATSQVTMKGLLLTLNCYVKRNSNGIALLFESSKLLTLLQTISALSGNNTLQTVGELSKNYDGLRLGFDFN